MSVQGAVKKLHRCLLLLACLVMVSPAFASEWQQQASALLQRQLNINPNLLLELDRPELNAFYRARGYRPIWSTEDGLSMRAYELNDALRQSYEHGLDPSEYFIDEISKRIKASSMQPLIDLELWLTAALYRYANDLYSGRLDPFAIDADWHIRNTPLDNSALLEAVAREPSIAALLAGLAPDQEAYRQMRQNLKRYRQIVSRGGWGKIKSWPKLEPGVRHAEVARLRQRLAIEGDLPAQASHGELYDEVLRKAVKHYQRRNGLAASGKIDNRTLHELNISVVDRIAQIRINMEHWRWLPSDLGRRYVAVNMTGFELDIIDDDEVVLSMPVVIGKPFQATPALDGVISSLVYNPYWTLSKNVMWESFIPGQIRNPDYLSARSIKVFKGWAEAEEVDPKEVDWTALDPKHNSPYWMRQDPGAGNALGQVKFLFSNPYRIYLHGSPQKHLFNRTVRTYSHGCIRVKDPAKLAEYLQHGPDPLVKKAVASKISSGVNEKVRLPDAIPVYLLYWTAWVDEHGVLNFRDDIYGRDADLRSRLQG